jgi:hypothetical protein
VATAERLESQTGPWPYVRSRTTYRLGRQPVMPLTRQGAINLMRCARCGSEPGQPCKGRGHTAGQKIHAQRWHEAQIENNKRHKVWRGEATGWLCPNGHVLKEDNRNTPNLRWVETPIGPETKWRAHCVECEQYDICRECEKLDDRRFVREDRAALERMLNATMF